MRTTTRLLFCATLAIGASAPLPGHAAGSQRLARFGRSMSLGWKVVVGGNAKMKSTVKERAAAKTRLVAHLDELRDAPDSFCGFQCVDKVATLRRDAEILGVKLDEKQLGKAIDTMVRGRLRNARGYAEVGMVEDVRFALDEVRADAKKLGVTLPHDELAAITRLGFERGLAAAWKEADAHATSGFMPGFEAEVAKIQTLSKEIGASVDAEKMSSLASRAKKQAAERKKQQALMAKLESKTPKSTSVTEQPTRKTSSITSSYGWGSTTSHDSSSKDDDWMTNPLSPQNFLNPLNPLSPISIFND